MRRCEFFFKNSIYGRECVGVNRWQLRSWQHFLGKLSLRLDVGMFLCITGGRRVYEFRISIHVSFNVMDAYPRGLRISLNYPGRPYWVWFGGGFFPLAPEHIGVLILITMMI